MSTNLVHLKMPGIGYSTVFTDAGTPLIFKDGMCALKEDQQTEEVALWLEAKGKANKIERMPEDEVKAHYDYLAKLAAEAEVKASRQSRVDQILQGVDPQLIPAAEQTSGTIATTMATAAQVQPPKQPSVQERLAAAKLANAASNKT